MPRLQFDSAWTVGRRTIRHRAGQRIPLDLPHCRNPIKACSLRPWKRHGTGPRHTRSPIFKLMQMPGLRLRLVRNIILSCFFLKGQIFRVNWAYQPEVRRSVRYAAERILFNSCFVTFASSYYHPPFSPRLVSFLFH